MALAGCSGETNGSTFQGEEKGVELELSRNLPALDRGVSIAGTDANWNNIRDDIDRIISRAYTNEKQRKAAIQVARALQASLLIDTSNIAAVKVIDREISRAINCVYSSFDGTRTKQPAQVIQELESITANTKERLRAYLQFNKALDGTSSALPEGDTCE